MGVPILLCRHCAPLVYKGDVRCSEIKQYGATIVGIT